MKKNTLQLIAIGMLICGIAILLGVGIWLGVSGSKDVPKTSTGTEYNEDDWTNNY